MLDEYTRHAITRYFIGKYKLTGPEGQWQRFDDIEDGPSARRRASGRAIGSVRPGEGNSAHRW